MACVSASWTPTAHLHVGNLAWAAAGGDGGLPPTDSLAWGDPLVGFADIWSDGRRADVSLHVDPRASAGIHHHIVAEIVELAPQVALEASRQDSPLVTALMANGFSEQEGPWYVQLSRDMFDLSDLDTPTPSGYRVRATGPDELVERVELHQRCWAPARIKSLLGIPLAGNEAGSSSDVDKHRNVMASPVYRPELDIVAEATDGSLCAYGIGWFDPRSSSVLFEPIGTDPNHSQLGLARAVCAEILRTAAGLGATHAVVGPRGDDAYPIPRHLYERLGMIEVAQHVEYRRDT